MTRRNNSNSELSHHPFRGMFDLMLVLVFFFAIAVLISMRSKNDAPIDAGPIRDEMFILHTMKRKIELGPGEKPLNSLNELDNDDSCKMLANNKQTINQSDVILLEKHRDEMWKQYGGELKKRVLDDKLERTISQDLLTFEPAKATPESTKNLDIIQQEALTQYHLGYRRIRIEGHTDNIPINTAQFPSNWELSAARAIWLGNKMELYFKENGIPIGNDGVIIEAIGYGERMPAKNGNNNSSDGRRNNRRIEIKYER